MDIIEVIIPHFFKKSKLFNKARTICIQWNININKEGEDMYNPMWRFGTFGPWGRAGFGPGVGPWGGAWGRGGFGMGCGFGGCGFGRRFWW